MRPSVNIKTWLPRVNTVLLTRGTFIASCMQHDNKTHARTLMRDRGPLQSAHCTGGLIKHPRARLATAQKSADEADQLAGGLGPRLVQVEPVGLAGELDELHGLAHGRQTLRVVDSAVAHETIR